MATWIAHLRVAENLLKQSTAIDVVPFLVGNIGPDSGLPNEDWSQFTPPKVISHWENQNKEIDAEDFKYKYLTEISRYSNKDFSFYLGYYIHLLCDIQWGVLYRKKKEEPLYKDNLEKDPKFIWTIKEDWYGLDHLYLRDHKDNLFFKEFIHIKEFPNTYLEFFPPEAFTVSVKSISDYYLGFHDSLDRDFIYLSKKEMEKYIEETTSIVYDNIINILKVYYL